MLSNLYYAVAIAAYGIFILQFILSQIFGDVDIDIDCDGNTDFDVSDVMSFKGLIHFLMGCFGWLSACQYINNSVTYKDWIIGFFIGVAFLIILYFVYKLITKFQHIPEIAEGNSLVGLHGNVKIVNDYGAVVSVFVNGEVKEIVCKNLRKVYLEPGQDVVILEYKNNNYYI